MSNYFKEYLYKKIPTIWSLGSYVLPGYAPPQNLGGQVQAGSTVLPPVLPPQAVPPIPHLGPQGF